MLEKIKRLSSSTPNLQNVQNNKSQKKDESQASSSKPNTLDGLKKSAKLAIPDTLLLQVNSDMKEIPSITYHPAQNLYPSTAQPVPSTPTISLLHSSPFYTSKLNTTQNMSSLSLLKQKAALTNGLITGISERYIERINLLQNNNKIVKQKLAICTEKLEEIINENQKNMREIGFLKQRLELLQSENTMMRFQVKELQSSNRQFHFSNQIIKQQNQSHITQIDFLKKKLQNFQKNHKEVIEALTQACTITQKDKQKLEYQCQQLKVQNEQNTKIIGEQKKEMVRIFNFQKTSLLKRIRKLENQLHGYINKTSELQTDQLQLKKSIELEKDYDKKMKDEIENLTHKIYRLKQSLSLTENSLLYAQEEKKSLMAKNQEIKKLQIKLIEKDDLIFILRQRNTELEGIVGQLQQKINEIGENMEKIQLVKNQLEEDKKDLNERITEHQLSIAKLVSEIENFQHKTEVIQAQLSKVEEKRDEMQRLNKQIAQSSQILKDRIKKTEAQLEQEGEKNKDLQQYASILKVKNEELNGEVFKLNLQKMTMSQQIARLTNETQEFDQRKSMLQSQIGDLKEQKQMKQSLFMQKISQLSKRQRTKQRQIEELQQQISNLRARVKDLSQENRERSNELINKQSQLQEMNDELFELKGHKYRLEQQLESFQEECSRLRNRFRQNEQQLEQLRQYVQELEIHINELDNILVWDFEEGRGQSNNYAQRKSKMEYIVSLLQQKMGEIDQLKSHQQHQKSVIHNEQKTNEDYKNLIAKFNEKIAKFLQEKDGLTKMIEDIEINNKKLAEKLNDLKEKQLEWKSKERGLNRQIKFKDSVIFGMNQQKKSFLEKIELLQKRINEKQNKIETLNQQYNQQRQKSASLKQMVERLTAQRKRSEDESARRTKELISRYEIERKQNQERRNTIAQLQIDKKTQVNTLSIELAQLKNIAKQFTAFYESQKFNFMKRNLLLVDMGTALTKFEKANNIKPLMTAPLKDFIKKMQQFDNNSSKLFSKYSKYRQNKQT